MEKKDIAKKMESPRDIEIREKNQMTHIKSMTPIWKDRHARKHGGKSKYDNSLKAYQSATTRFSKDS